MRVSVVMCTWNGAAFVEEQLLSILDQSRAPDEVIIRDDASDDATVSIVRRVARSRPCQLTLVQAPANEGVVSNFGAALARATGDIIFLADQDDIWHRDKVELTLRHFQRATTEAVFSNGDVIDGSGRSLGYTLWQWARFGAREQRLVGDGDALRVLLRRNVATGATLAMRAGLRDRALPLSSACLHDEWIALLAAVTPGGLAMEPTCLIAYRQHGGNAVGARQQPLGVRLRAARTVPNRPRLDDQIRMTNDVLERVAQLPAAADALPLLRERVAHLERRRAAAAAPRIVRASAIVRELLRGGYTRFASKRHALRDLLAPPA